MRGRPRCRRLGWISSGTSKPTDDDQARNLQHTTKKRPFGVTAVDDDPNSFSRFFQDRRGPLDQASRELEFRRKAEPASRFGDRIHRFLANIKHGSKRQADRAPLRMSDRKRNGHPDMPVQKRLVGRTRRRVVVKVGALDLRTVSLRRRVVDHQQQPLGQWHDSQNQQKDSRGNRAGLASDGGKMIGSRRPPRPHAVRWSRSFVLRRRACR